MKKLAFLALCFVVALTACRDDKNSVNITETPYEPPILEWTQLNIPVNGDLTGFVVDENGQPIESAEITMGSITTKTDVYGHFFFNNVTMNAEGTYVKVYKSGYFDGSRRFFAMEGQENRIKIEMIAQSFDQSFESSQGGEITLDGGASIFFNEDAIKKEDGTAYNGSVQIAAKWLDPSASNTLDQMPGNLQGVDNLAEEVALGTYGMIAVELESDSGEPLNLKEGKPATLRMPVPASMVADAPSKIPLWSFHEEHGIWMEEGLATLTNGVYIGEVSHFSFWNCDVPFPLISFTAIIEDTDGNPADDIRVAISTNSMDTGYGYTDSNGSVSGKVPADEELTIHLFGPCGDELYTQTIAPSFVNINLGTITIGIAQTIVSGELVDCDGNPVTDGVAIFEFDGQSTYAYTSTGSFTKAVYPCPSTSSIEVIGADHVNLLQSNPVTVGVGGNQSTGQINVCDIQLENYIKVTVNGETGTYFPANIYSSPSSNTTWISYETPTSQIAIQFGGVTTGTYNSSIDDDTYFELIFDESQDWYLSWTLGSLPNDHEFIITEYGGIGDPIIGTFSGTVTDENNQSALIQVTGEFNIILQ